jgi:hypothetical protein
MTAALDFLAGNTSPEVLVELRAQMLRWVEQAGERSLPLHRFIGLGVPRFTRIALRNHHLLRVAAMLPGPTSWKRCEQLADACRIFENRRYPAWRAQKLDSPPDHATEIDRELWEARQFGPLACSPENYLDLLSET